MFLSMFGRPLAVNCDWLAFSCKINPSHSVSAPHGMRWEKLNGTNVFKERWILYNTDGSKVLTFCCNPYSSVLRDDIATCQFANPYLYSPNVPWLSSLLPYFRGACFNGLSRWDVCCDFCPSPAEFKTIRKLTDGSQYVSGKSEGSIFWHSERYGSNEFRMAHCLSWGSAASSLKIKLYNKSLEINAHDEIMCEKPYIRSEWDGFLPDLNSVWRLEFSLTDVNQMAIDDRRLLFDDALSSDIMCRFFSEVKRKRFVIRMNQGRRNGHKNEDCVVPFLPFEISGASIRKALPLTDRTPLDESRSLARHLWMHLQDRSVLCDELMYSRLRSVLLDMCEDVRVWSYLDSLCDGTFDSWLFRLDECRGAGVFDLSEGL